MSSLLELIEVYVEARHKYGAPEYNSKSAEARKAMLDMMKDIGVLEKAELPQAPSSGITREAYGYFGLGPGS